MKTVILCGGRGTRMREETEYRPKPLVEIGGSPILWHIMKIYAAQGFKEFILALGYKGDMIRDHFLNYRTFSNDFTLDMARQKIIHHGNAGDDFIVTFADTGIESMTGDRLLRLRPYLENEKEFMLTYGDGVADINIDDLLAFHRTQGTIGTITGARPSSKYGFVNVDEQAHLITDFHEKPLMKDNYVNSGFMVFNREVFNYLEGGMLEAQTLPKLAQDRQLSIFLHKGFWKAMDTHKEMEELNKLWESGQPWNIWKNK